MKLLCPRSVISLLAASAATVILVACVGGGSGGTSDSTATMASSPATGGPPSATPAGLVGTALPAATITASPAFTAPAAPPSAAAALVEAAKAAALKDFDAIYTSPMSAEKCQGQPPPKKACIELRSSPDDALHGVLKFALGDPDGPGGAALYYARMQDGSWHFWFGTQQAAWKVIRFPADAFVCAGGTGLNVREQPSPAATVVTLLKDLSVMRTEEFVLTQPGDPPGARTNGPGADGWYRISSPVQGWVNYRFVSEASLKTCEEHDAQARAG